MTFGQLTANANRRESLLLRLGGAFLAINALILAIATDSLEPIAMLAVWGLAAYGGHRLLDRGIPQRDPFLFPLAMLLTGWGLLMIQRLAPDFAWKQAIWLYVGLAAMQVVGRLPIHLRWLRRYRYTWLMGGLLLLLGTIALGVNPSGAGPRLWLGLGGMYFQPSELLKLVLVIFLASYLADYADIIREGHEQRRFPPLQALAPLVLMWGISMVVVIWQQDLGTAALFFIAFLIMLYIASGRMIYIVAGLILLLLASLVAYRFVDVVRLRIDIWLNPWLDADGRAFQIVQSLLAFASGSLFGQGLGLGSPGYVPVVHSDFIFAALGEEWGLLGVLTAVSCFAVLIMRGLQLAALWSNSRFRMLLAVGLSILLATQCLLIMGGVLKIIPMTGVTLPFMSYGGSSLLLNFSLIGLLLVLSSGPSSLADVEDMPR